MDGRDRAQLERLARYVLRPPLSQERLERRPDGRLELTLKSVRKDGTRALLLEPHDLLVRPCAAIPPPGFHMTRYFRVLSSHSAHRHEVVPALGEPERFQAEPAEGDQLGLEWNGADARTCCTPTAEAGVRAGGATAVAAWVEGAALPLRGEP